ncbi:MAG: sulfite exporter TauE/SafE family protein [Clostridiales bacterium]|nr:sulfite exporter TauE/SafE family protein [Clostridiales bacterium]
MLRFFIGLVFGVISGMGIGGGTILIPALIFLAGISQQAAQGVNLAAFFPTAVFAIYLHIRNGYIRYRIAFYMFLSGSIGAFLGAMAAACISTGVLRRLFGIFLLIMGIYEFTRGGGNKRQK